MGAGGSNCHLPSAPTFKICSVLSARLKRHHHIGLNSNIDNSTSSRSDNSTSNTNDNININIISDSSNNKRNYSSTHLLLM